MRVGGSTPPDNARLTTSKTQVLRGDAFTSTERQFHIEVFNILRGRYADCVARRGRGLSACIQLNATLAGLLTDVDEPLVRALTQTTAAPAELYQAPEEVRLPSQIADKLRLTRPIARHARDCSCTQLTHPVVEMKPTY